jgi:hypothetical protein
MEMYADEGDIQRSIQTAIRVAAYQYAEYTEMTVCSLSLTSLCDGGPMLTVWFSIPLKLPEASSNLAKYTAMGRSRLPC